MIKALQDDEPDQDVDCYIFEVIFHPLQKINCPLRGKKKSPNPSCSLLQGNVK